MIEDKYKIYKLDVLIGSEEVRNGLDFLRMDEPGFIVGILPIGESRVHHAVRFIIKDKCFYDLGPDGSISEISHPNVKELINYMRGIPAARGMAVPQSTPMISGQKPVALKGLEGARPKTSTTHKHYRISPAVEGKAPLISDRYKIKSKDDISDGK